MTTAPQLTNPFEHISLPVLRVMFAARLGLDLNPAILEMVKSLCDTAYTMGVQHGIETTDSYMQMKLSAQALAATAIGNPPEKADAPTT